MNYEINIAKDGRHFFATAERSITTMDAAQKVLKVLTEKFPESEGYHISVSRCPQISYGVNKEALLDGTYTY